MHLNKEPLSLFGEGNYALTDVKEIVGTEAFLSLDEGIKLCQDFETYQDCMTKEYIKNGVEKCSCTPYELRNFSKTVKTNNRKCLYYIYFLIS